MVGSTDQGAQLNPKGLVYVDGCGIVAERWLVFRCRFASVRQLSVVLLSLVW